MELQRTAEELPRVEEKIPARRRNRDLPRRTADLLVQELVAAGVDTVFGLPGGNIAPIFDALLDQPGVRVITTRHESHAAFAAAGYAQSTGRLGVAAITSGPGVLNAFNALASAQADGLPLLVLAGEAARAGFGRGAVQEGSAYALNVVGMAKHICKLAFEAHDANLAPSLLRRAISTALAGPRGAVLASLPLDVQGLAIPPPAAAVEVSTEHRLAPGALTSAAKALASGDSKLLLVGSGARGGRGPALVRELAERLQCPVMTTPKAKGVFPESHPLSVGVFGMGGHPSARAALAGGVDVVMVLGSSLKEDSTDCWSQALAARRSLVHVDIDAAKLGKAYATDLAICAPLELVVQELLPLLPPAPPPRRFGVLRDLDPAREHLRTAPLSAPRALWELQQALPADTIFTADSGSNAFFAIHYLSIDRPDGFVIFFGLASMGSSLPGALGVQAGQPGRTVVAVCGDGGFHMSAAELATAAQSGLPLVVLVLNDARLGMVEVGNRKLYGRTPPYPTGPLDVPTLAAASGADCLVATRPGEILAAGLGTWRRERPLVIDARIDPTTPVPAASRFNTLGKVVGTAKLKLN